MTVYKIETDNFTAAVAQLVDTFKKTNPSVGEFKCTCHDGSKVTIRIANNTKPVRKTQP